MCLEAHDGRPFAPPLNRAYKKVYWEMLILILSHPVFTFFIYLGYDPKKVPFSWRAKMKTIQRLLTHPTYRAFQTYFVHLKSWHLTFSALLLIFSPTSFCATIPNTIIDTINGFQNPEGVAITPNGKYAYVTNNGAGYVSVVDVANNTVLNTPGLNSGTLFSAYIAITPNGKYAYVTNGGADYVSLIDIATNTVIAAPGLVGPFNGPNGITITPDGAYAYVTNIYSATVNVIDIARNTVLDTPGLTGAFNVPGLIAITPDGRYAYVTNNGSTTVSVIDTKTNTIVKTIAGFANPYGIAITSDGRYVYVTNNPSTVSIIDTTTNRIVHTIDGFDGPVTITITPNGQYAYVPNYNSQTVSVINLATNTIISTPGLNTGFTTPSNVTITPDGQLAYVSNYEYTTLSVIALPVSAPANLQGVALRNTFLMQTEFVNKITWQAPGLPLPVTYSIYRDAELTDLAATVPATEPLMFCERVLPDSRHSYYVVGTDGVGVVSPAAVVVVTQSC